MNTAFCNKIVLSFDDPKCHILNIKVDMTKVDLMKSLNSKSNYFF